MNASETTDATRAPSQAGRCFGVGVGPGDPELVTLKAARVLRESGVVAFFAARGRPSNARRVVQDLLGPEHVELRLEYPITTEVPPAGESYDSVLADFYDTAAKQLAEVLDAGRDVAVLCEGDPFFYGSFMYLHNRLSTQYAVDVVPGVPAMLAGAAQLGIPLVCRNEVLSVLSGVTPIEELAAQIERADAAVVMKVGRNLPSVIEAVRRAGRLDDGIYVERATMVEQRTMSLVEAGCSGEGGTAISAPYFSLVVIPSTTARNR